MPINHPINLSRAQFEKIRKIVERTFAWLDNVEDCEKTLKNKQLNTTLHMVILVFISCLHLRNLSPF